MSPKLKYLLPSIAQALFVVVLLQLVLHSGHRLLADCDTGIHIKAGEYILETRSIPKNDPFSLFSPPMPWPTHEWLSDVIMASIAKIGGLSGVVLFFIAMISFTYSIFFRVLRANQGNFIVDIILIILVLATSQMHWLARPHMFTLILFIAWYHILESFQNDRNNFLYLLPPMMLFWVNLHGGFVLGFVTITIYLLYNLIRLCLSEGAEKKLHSKKAKCLLGVAIASVLASLVNPKGFHALLFPFNVVSNHLIMDNYAEFLSPDFHLASLTPFRWLILIMIACFGISKGRLNFIELALVLIFVNMSLFSARYIPIFSVAVAPVLSKHGNALLHQTNNKLANLIVQKTKVQQSIDETARGYVWPVVSIILAILLVASNRVTFAFDEKIKPVAAVGFLNKEHLPGNMFNNDEFSDYIIYSAYPRYKVFFDGRADIYGNEKLQEYLDIARMRPGWEKLFDKYDINWIIFNTDSPLTQYLALKQNWKRIYADNLANIYIKNIPRNEHLIRKYGNSSHPIIGTDAR